MEITINVKYAPGDTVYRLYGNAIQECKVRGVYLNCDMCLDGTIDMSIISDRIVRYDLEPDGVNSNQRQGSLGASPEEVLDSVKNNIVKLDRRW